MNIKHNIKILKIYFSLSHQYCLLLTTRIALLTKATNSFA